MIAATTADPGSGVIHLVRQIEMGVRRPVEELVTGRGITLAAYSALTVLRDRPGITSSELARCSSVRTQTMAVTVTSLCAAGLVRREVNPRHRRQLSLFLTGAGRRLLASLAHDVAVLESRMTGHLSPEEASTLVRTLQRLGRQ